MPQEMKVMLSDVYGEDRLIEATVTLYHNGIGIKFRGYGDLTSLPGYGEPIYIECAKGHPQVYVWGNINEEEPTDTISLIGAKESNRKQA